MSILTTRTFLTADTILSLSEDPRHIIIFGAGVIGCEYASIFRGFRSAGLIWSIPAIDCCLLWDAEISDAFELPLLEFRCDHSPWRRI